MDARIPEPYLYLDYAATAPLCPEAAEAMAPFDEPGAASLALNANPNSLHGPGRAAYRALEQARRSLAQCLGARRPDEVTFTGGATEADNAALWGLACAERLRRAQAGRPAAQPHVIVGAIEHEAVLQPARALRAAGFRVTELPASRQGFVEVRSLEAALDADTVLVSVQAANSEVGSVQPVAELAACAHEAGALFHTDAVQALGKVPLSVEALGVDAASFSAHKLGGPRGVGALYLRARTPFAPLLRGGGQESGRRSGTQNVRGAVGFAAAASAVTARVADDAAAMMALRERLYGALAALPSVQPTVDVAPGSLDYLPNVASVLVEGLESETMVLRFDGLGIGVSGGSACSSHSLEPSHVLRAMGVPADLAQGALRVSFGRDTVAADVDAFLAAVPKVLRWEGRAAAPRELGAR